MLFYLVAVVFHQLENKPSVHEGQEVIEEEGQADVDFLRLLYLLKQQSTNSYLYRADLADHYTVQAEFSDTAATCGLEDTDNRGCL